jgi:hypothetical protein
MLNKFLLKRRTQSPKCVAALRTHSHEVSKTTCDEGDLRANAKECDATQKKEVGATGLEPVTFAV